MLDSPFKFDDDPVGTFVEDFLLFDDKGTPGISPEPLDQVNINSGIHVALNPDTVGVFLNKSGKGIRDTEKLLGDYLPDLTRRIL